MEFVEEIFVVAESDGLLQVCVSISPLEIDVNVVIRDIPGTAGKNHGTRINYNHSSNFNYVSISLYIIS